MATLFMCLTHRTSPVRFFRRLLPLLAAVLCTLAPGQAVADGSGITLDWDPDQMNGNGLGGDGVWDAVTANWYYYEIRSDTEFLRNAAAVFGNFPGTVSLNAGGITAGEIVFTASGYVLQDAAGTAYTLTAGQVASSFASGTATVSVPLTLTAGTLLAHSGSILAIGGAITVSAPLQPLLIGASSFTGTVSLSGNNSLSNGINVNYGTLAAVGGTALGKGNVELAASTQLQINAGVVLTSQFAATLTLDSATTSTVDLIGRGVQDTVASLLVAGVNELPGTYGALGSGATFVLPDFAGTGELQVGTVPEPSTWAFLSASATVAGAVVQRRRRV